MNFDCQSISLDIIAKLADRQAPSILIVGPEGCGKSYLARQFAIKSGIADFAFVEPTVASIREISELCSEITTPIVICIENLDTGVSAASYTLLKFLEEPRKNVHVVVTARNITLLPDTIPSRCVTVWMSQPTERDLLDYARISAPATKLQSILDSAVFKACRGFTDVTKLLNLTNDQLAYLIRIPTLITANESLSVVVWKLTHYADNSPLDSMFALKCIAAAYDGAVRRFCINAITDIQSGRVSAHTAIAKFIFDCRYANDLEMIRR